MLCSEDARCAEGLGILAMWILTQASRSAAAHSGLSVSRRSALPPSHQVGKETVHHPAGGGL